ncbi:MAG: Crp/Fnr family transcriptional regulator [Candidatus Binatia bacterium]
MNQLDAKDLQKLKNLAAFSPDELEKLAYQLSIKSFKKNEIVFDQDEEARFIYVLLSGIVRVSYINNQQRHTIVSLLPAGEIFGIDALQPRAHHAFRSQAFSECQIGSIKPQTFVEMLLGTPYENFLRWHVATLHLGWTAYLHCIRGIGLDLRRRLALELLNLADRFGSADSRGVAITLSISHEDLAGIVGASRQQVTEYLNHFDRDRIIFREGRRIIVNLQKLNKILQGATGV